MKEQRTQELPPDIEQVIREVLESADLHMVDGAEEVANELRAHFEDGLAAGTPAPELIAKFGNPALVGERIARTRPKAAARSRGEHGGWWMSPNEWWNEIRRAARRLKRAPGFAFIVILTLGLGVGANTAIFTVLDAVLLQELPYPEPERLVRVYENHEEFGSSQFLRAPTTVEWRSWDEVFDGLGALYTYREVGADLTDGDQPERVSVVRVSADYFETLGIQAANGPDLHGRRELRPG